jgi:hypothetical protein
MKRATSRRRPPGRDAEPATHPSAKAGRAKADASRLPQTDAEAILGTEDASLLDIVDNVLSKGVVLSGDVTIGLAQVDLVYARLSLLLCAADRVMPSEDEDVLERHSARHRLRERQLRR